VPVRTLTAALIVAAVVAAPGAQSMTRPGAPESFRANGQILGAAGGAASAIHIQIDKYTSDADHAALADALKQGGNEAFVAALRKAPKIGSLKVGNRSVAVPPSAPPPRASAAVNAAPARWARGSLPSALAMAGKCPV